MGKEITKNFGGTRALDGVDFEIEAGEKVGLIGPNGSGKTTLVNVITGRVKGEGKVIFEGKDISSFPPHKIASLGLARTFQIPKPFTGLSVYQNIALPTHFANPSSDSQKIVKEIIEMLSLESITKSFPDKLNMVELRKLELARALILQPKVLFIDEALTGLRKVEWEELLDVINEINEKGTAIIMIEHIMEAVMDFSKRVIVLDQGRKLAGGKPKEIAQDEKVVKTYFGE